MTPSVRSGIIISSAVVFLVLGCRKDDPGAGLAYEVPTTIYGATIQIDIAGRVLDANGDPVAGALVTAGFSAHSTSTDELGAFVLNGITAYDKLGYVLVSKTGYFDGSRSFLPITGLNTVRITLLPRTLSGAVQGSAGGMVMTGGAQVWLPSGGFVRDGMEYTGLVNVYMHHLDPSEAAMQDRMPGSLLGSDADELQLLRSFGMVIVELTDNAGVPVSLSPGSIATLQLQVPTSLMPDAQQSIDLWHFDAELGHWIREGQAQLTGNEYTAQVSHFSWWNCDVPSDFVQLNGDLVLASSDEPISGARIEVASQTMGSGVTYSNPAGSFGGPVPSGQSLTISVFVDCAGNGAELVHQQVVGPFSSNVDLTLAISGTGTGIVSGTVTDCNGASVANGYVVSGGVLHFFTGGAFDLVSCTGAAVLTAYDQVNDLWSNGTNIIVNEGVNTAGVLQACGAVGGAGTVVDIDGNVYPTVVIGSQKWTKTNLRTSRYANGDVIPQVMDPSTWAALTSGAWSTAFDDYEVLYGKHYNWYAVSDPRNVCPSGWHAATDDDWKLMELALGMSMEDADDAGLRGVTQNVGGKLKSLSDLWSTPNTGATNESGFTADPGGLVWGGIPSGEGYWARFWTSTEAGPGHGWIRNLDKSNGGVYRSGTGNAEMQQGHSVRCVQD